ncbi:MAG: DNA polymerase III subunit delta' [Candidatus Aminicenantes bacterium]|nr:DNA polymerase III subunit delta' [Candidatus Aminicenantes bacterium]
MAFKDITGNNRVKSILSKALAKGRLPNSLLFIGPDGVGKYETALVVAKALNCLNKKDDACETCSACVAINEDLEGGRFPDVIRFSPKNDVLTIDQMRFLKNACYLKPMVGKKRVFIVKEAEKMNESAANSLLKILEEPPLFSHIILISNNPFLILSTIKSRCQILTFSPVSREDIERSLIQRGFAAERAGILSLMAGGNLKLAVEMDWNEVKEIKTRTWDFFISLLFRDNAVSGLNELVLKQRTDGLDYLKEILGILLSFCRDIILLKQGGDIELLLNPEYLKDLKTAAERLPLQGFLSCLNEIDRALYMMNRKVNANLNLSAAYLRLSNLFRCE